MFTVRSNLTYDFELLLFRPLIALREEVAADPEMEWATTVLEKIETIPLDRAAVLALLNRGPGGVVGRREIIETIGSKA